MKSKAKPHTFNALIVAGVCLLVFFRPLVSGMTYPWSNTYIQTMLLVICAAWLLRILWRKSTFFRTPLDVPLITFFLCLTVSALQSVNSALSLNHTYEFMSCVLLYFIITNNIKTRRERRAVILALYLSVTLVCLYGIYQYFWGLDNARRIVSLNHFGEYPPEFIARLATEKAFSTFVYPPALAGFLVLVMPLSLSLCLGGRNRTGKTRFSQLFWVPASVGMTLLILSCLTLTFSKAGWLSALLSMVVFAYVWFAVIKRRKKTIVISALLIPIVIFVLLLVSGCLPKVTLSGFASSFSVRLGYWKAVPSMVKDHPFLGSGPATFGTIYPAHRPLLAHETQMAHNNYLQVLVETGIAGFLAFLWLWARFLKRGIKLIKYHRQKVLVLGCFAGIVGFLIQSLVDFGLYIPGITMTMFLLMALMETQEEPLPTQKANTTKLTKIALTVIILSLTSYMLWAVRMPMLGDRYFGRALKCLKENDVNKSMSLSEKALKYSPRRAKYHFQLGFMYEGKLSEWGRQKGKRVTGRIWLDKAIASYENAVRYNPHMALYHSKLAWLYWSKSAGRNERLMEKAIRELENAVSCYPVLPKYHMQLGRIYHLAGRYESARKEYALTFECKDAVYRESQKENLSRMLKQVETWIRVLDKLEQ